MPLRNKHCHIITQYFIIQNCYFTLSERDYITLKAALRKKNKQNGYFVHTQHTSRRNWQK